jgi:translation initiation factor eIF-2B subunit delta
VNSATIKLGTLFKTGLIRDDDDRVTALIATFCRVIEDYSTPPNTSLSWNLDKVIKAQVQYLVDIRQHSIGMGNLIKHLRSAIACIPPDMSESDAKQRLLRTLRLFLEEKIIFARDGIIKQVLSIIKDDDVILTFGSSPLLRQVLLDVAAVRRFKLVVVDSRPLKEGLATVSALSAHVKCVYTTVAGVASMMREVSHVLLGASSLLSNGTALAPAGTAMVAALGKAHRLPVLFAAETYKFSEKVQLDSIVYNELGNPSEIAIMGGEEPASQTDLKYRGALERPPGPEEGGAGGGGQTFSTAAAVSVAQTHLPFQVVNLRYDLTPINLISAIVTETGVIPPTSIPVLIRELMSDQQQAM